MVRSAVHFGDPEFAVRQHWMVCNMGMDEEGAKRFQMPRFFLEKCPRYHEEKERSDAPEGHKIGDRRQGDRQVEKADLNCYERPYDDERAQVF